MLAQQEAVHDLSPSTLALRDRLQDPAFDIFYGTGTLLAWPNCALMSAVCCHWLLLKRLEQDRFSWPREAAVAMLTVEQLHWLLEGIDLAAVRRHPQREYLRAG
jgi:IS66 Orf2 like protein